MKPSRAQDLGTVIARSDVLSELNARVALMARVQQALQLQWPALPLRVLSMRDGVLTLTAPGNAVVAKARQLEPSLLGAAQRVNPSLQSVRFKANRQPAADAASHATGPPRSRQISADSLEHIQMAASSVGDGSVRSALERIIRRQLGGR